MLLMLSVGVRTSEATEFSYKHLVEVRFGYWALVRYEVSAKNSRSTQASGKTNNAFRLLPLPQFLAAILQRRKVGCHQRPGLCIQADSISPTTSAAQGVEAMRLRPPHAVFAAVGMELVSTDPKRTG